MKIGLSTRIAIIVTGVAAAALASIVAVSGYVFDREYTTALQSRALAIATGLEVQAQRVLALGLPLESLIGFEEQCQEVVAEYGDIDHAMVVGRDGTVLFHSDPRRRGEKVAAPALLLALGEERPRVVAYAAGGREHYGAVVPVVAPGGGREASVVVGFPAALIAAGSRRVASTNAVLGLLFLAVATVVLVATLSARVTGPLTNLIATLQEIRRTRTDLSRRVPVSRRGGDIARLAETFNGLMDDLQATTVSKAELDAEKERLAVTLRSIADGVITADTAGAVVLMNAVAEQLTGWTQEEAIGRPLATVFHLVGEDPREPPPGLVEAVLAPGGGLQLAQDSTLSARDGRERSITYSGAPIRARCGGALGAVFVLRDVTEKNKMEAELLRGQKLESVGILAGGIAHDFNNILTSILGNVSFARGASPGEPLAEVLEDVEKAALRAKDLTRQLLTFSRGGAPIKKVGSLTEVIQDSAQFVLRGSKTRAEFAIAEDLWPAAVDEGQMSQVIQNIVLNADQAMPHGGIVRIGAANVEVTGAGPIPLRAGRFVCISIADGGVGIAPEHLDRIFDPYFTTKRTGTGLGLTTCYSIVRSHDGHIAVESTRGNGSTFSIYLPASQVPPAARAAPAPGARGRPGRVLVMDDEEPVRVVVGRMLRALGYDVEFAADGEEAIALYAAAREEPRPFDVVMMDLTIPGGMGGEQAMKRLLSIDPGVRAVVSSGYSTDPIMADFRKYGFSCVLTKPYSLEDLGRALEEAWSASGAEGLQAPAADPRGAGPRAT